MSRPVFVDSGAFIAWLVREERRHREADELFSDPPASWMTSLAVVAESYAWFLHRFGEESARNFRLGLADLPRLTLLELGRAHHRAVERKLERLRGRKLTYVDASSLVFIAEHRIKTVWGTDLDLGLEGATVVPGP